MDTKNVGNSGLIGNLPPTPKTDKADLVAKLKQKRADQAGSTGAASAADYGLDVSQKARDMAQARAKATEIARNTPDIREDRVAELKKKIQDGTYQVQPEKIADGIMREALRDQVATDMHHEAKERQ
jgi:negative regulator of flagellin synthesis FlgM